MEERPPSIPAGSRGMKPESHRLSGVARVPLIGPLLAGIAAFIFRGEQHREYERRLMPNLPVTRGILRDMRPRIEWRGRGNPNARHGQHRFPGYPGKMQHATQPKRFPGQKKRPFLGRR